uniref:sensor histidine kinase n=1 Tax=Sphingomonas bacterium TaxID=1895847 RepID=UPI00262A05C3|nr:ATP-binding protein [Sphingomonas bacterium]
MLVAGGAALLFLAVMVAAAQRWADAEATDQALAAATQIANTHAGMLESELQKYRLLPLVLTEYLEVRATLTTDPGAAARLNPKLALLAERTDAAVIYVLDAHGRAIAASNWRLPTSFVGHDYAFRPYFRDALAQGHAEQFALGAVSNRPGLFLAQRIDPADGHGPPIGVVVVKVEFDEVEARWRRQPGPSLITDAGGRVMLTSQAIWRFRTVEPLTHAGPLPVRRHARAATSGGQIEPLVIVDDDRRYVAAQTSVSIPGWHLRHLEPLDPFQASPAARARELMLAAAGVLAILFGLIVRAYEKRLIERDSRQRLEEEVERRTAELVGANRQLRIESTEREIANEQLRAAREELAQANRLGIIGQITEGVAHEENQPVAAIRTFAENAIRQIERSTPAAALRSLSSIVGLTARIGSITAELRTFARRGTPSVSAVSLEPAIMGALLLLGDRLQRSGVKVERKGDRDAGLQVVADRVRLEQVLINLVQNALDALDGIASPRLRIAVEAGETVAITVSDNGPGIAPDRIDEVFKPFVTGRAAGLGLGLGIARDIAREFGGQLALSSPVLGGASFTLTLRRPAHA